MTTETIHYKLDDEEGTGHVVDAEYLNDDQNWTFSQWFRTQESDETGSDILSTLAFSDDGEYLATGDVGGRVVVLKGSRGENGYEYQFHCEFNSHEPEFDYVRSQPINERINRVRFLPQTNNSQFLLATNDREIKLWKIYENGVEEVNEFNLGMSPKPFRDMNPEVLDPDNIPEINELKFPTIEKQAEDEVPYVDARLRHTFSRTVHEYNIHSVSLLSSGEGFLSADNLRVNQWDMNIDNKSFNVIDLRPDDIKQLKEWINATAAHPEHSNLFIYGTNKANVKLCDMRTNAHCEKAVRVFGNHESFGAGETNGFFDELTRSIADVQFSSTGRFCITRDFMTIKFWDTNMEKSPLETILIHEYLRPSEAMWHMYENELLQDRFAVGVSPTGDVVTGSYNNYFHIYNVGAKTDCFVQAAKPEPIGIFPLLRNRAVEKASLSEGSRRKNKFMPRLFGVKSGKNRKGSTTKSSKGTEGSITTDPYAHFNYRNIDFSLKVLSCAWHPTLQTVAIAGDNNLYLYKQDEVHDRRVSL